MLISINTKYYLKNAKFIIKVNTGLAKIYEISKDYENALLYYKLTYYLF